MSELSKKVREDRRKRAERLVGKRTDPHKKVDSSSWEPLEPINAEAKTGLRPVSRRQYKRGGKVGMEAEGDKSAQRADKRPRKSNSEEKSWVNAKVNRNVKDANEERDGVKHVGGLKRGGRSNKQMGGQMMPAGAQMMPAGDPRMAMVPKDRLNLSNRPPVYKKGGKAKANGGSARGERDPRDPDNPMNTESMGVGASELPDFDMVEITEEENMPNGRNVSRGPLRNSPMPNDPRVRNRKNGGKTDLSKDKRLVKKAMRQHEVAQHGGKHSELKLKKGGNAYGKRVSVSDDGSNYTGGTRPTGGRIARATGGPTLLSSLLNPKKSKSKGMKGKNRKGKTSINIVINAGKDDDDKMMMRQPPSAPPSLPPSHMRPPMPPAMPPGMPPGAPPGMPPGAPPGGIAGAPPGMPPGMSPGMPPGMPPRPMGRKSGGRAGKGKYRSYEDMDAGSGSGLGRLEKTEIARHKN